jgi:hypothetical protein
MSHDIGVGASWSLEQVVEMTADYMRCKEDAEFEQAFAVQRL